PAKYPPVRRSGARSTITGSHPALRRPIAAEIPAMPSPTTSARLSCCVIGTPLQKLRQSVATSSYDVLSQLWREGWVSCVTCWVGAGAEPKTVLRRAPGRPGSYSAVTLRLAVASGEAGRL